jgi:hypothetical protein
LSSDKIVQRKVNAASDFKQKLDSELKMLQNKSGIGYEVTVKWQPGAAEFGTGGRKLAEIVQGDTIFIFSTNLEEAISLVRHGFLEWLLNRQTRPYLRLINKLITLYEEQQYERKEKVIEALLNLL